MRRVKMPPGRALESFLCIALIAAFISSGICCNSDQWKCGSSDECIELYQVCDGRADCRNDADETSDTCITNECPTYTFHCAYGACVKGDALCNGEKDCADNSDEATVKCGGESTENNSSCNKDQWPCKSGDCINKDDLCNGNADCKDESDETADECARDCPPFSFRCGYGACISIDKKCDGKKDCNDESDEVPILCGTTTKKPTTNRPSPPTRTTRTPITGPRTSARDCKVPNITNGYIVYESDNTIIKPGISVQQHESILCKCNPGYNRLGWDYNACTDTGWKEPTIPECTKFCPNDWLKSVTFKADCEKNGAHVDCDDHIKPGTIAKISCKPKYKKPNRGPPDNVVCRDDGHWDFMPLLCEPICGEEVVEVKPFSAHGEKRNITYVPWHVGIFENFSGKFKHICGGTIINAKVVISAAHCFWNNANEKSFNESYYTVAAGKYYRDYYNTADQNAQFRDISQIVIPPEFNGATEHYKADIALLILNDSLSYSPFIAPICIKEEWAGTQYMPSNRYGRSAGWGEDETGGYSNELRTIDVATTSFNECRAKLGPRLANTIANDKFCVLNTAGAVGCSGDSGGGFTIKEEVDEQNISYLWGVVSAGVPRHLKCGQNPAVAYTNVQYYNTLISRQEAANRPR